MEFSRQEYCRGLSFPSPWDLPHSGIESGGFCKASRYLAIWGFPGGSGGKESTCKVGDLGLIAGLGRSPGELIGYPLQYSDLENSMDCIVHEPADTTERCSLFTVTNFPKIMKYTKS